MEDADHCLLHCNGMAEEMVRLTNEIGWKGGEWTGGKRWRAR